MKKENFIEGQRKANHGHGSESESGGKVQVLHLMNEKEVQGPLSLRSKITGKTHHAKTDTGWPITIFKKDHFLKLVEKKYP